MDRLIEKLLTGRPDVKFITETNQEVEADPRLVEQPFDECINKYLSKQKIAPARKLPFFSFMFLGALTVAHETELVFEQLKIDKLFVSYSPTDKQIKVAYAIEPEKTLHFLTISLVPESRERNLEKMRFSRQEFIFLVEALNLDRNTVEQYDTIWRVVWCTEAPDTTFFFEEIDDEVFLDSLTTAVQIKEVDTLFGETSSSTTSGLFDCFEKSNPKLPNEWPQQTDIDLIRGYCETTFSRYRSRYQQIIDKHGMQESIETSTGFLTGAVAFNQFRNFQWNVVATSHNQAMALMINSYAARTFPDRIPVLISIVNDDQIGSMIDEHLWHEDKFSTLQKTMATTSKRSLLLRVNFRSQIGDEIRSYRVGPINRGFITQLCKNFNLIMHAPKSELTRHLLNQEIFHIRMYLAAKTPKLIGRFLHGQTLTYSNNDPSNPISKYLVIYANRKIAANVDTFLFEKNREWIILNVVKNNKMDHLKYFFNEDPRFLDCTQRGGARVVQINVLFDNIRNNFECLLGFNFIHHGSAVNAAGLLHSIDSNLNILAQFHNNQFEVVNTEISRHLFPLEKSYFSSNLALKAFVRGLIFEFVEEDLTYNQYKTILRVRYNFLDQNRISRSQSFLIVIQNDHAGTSSLCAFERTLLRELDKGETQREASSRMIRDVDGVIKIQYNPSKSEIDRRFEAIFKPKIELNSEIDVDPDAGPSCSKPQNFLPRNKRSAVIKKECLVNEDDLDDIAKIKTIDEASFWEINGEKLSNFLQSHDELTSEHMLRYLTQQRFMIINGNNDQKTKKLLNSARTIQRLESAGKIAHHVSTGIIYKHMATDMFHGDYFAALFSAMLVKGDVIVSKALEGSTKILPSKYDSYINQISKSLKRSNFFGRLASVYNFYLLIRDSIGYYRTGRTENLVAAGTDATFLIVDLSALFFAGGELMAFLGPVGAVIVALVFLGNEIYQAHKITEAASVAVGLNWKERAYEDTVALFTGEISDELNQTLVEHDANTQLTLEKLKIMDRHPEIIRFIFPAVTIRNDQMTYHKDNTIILNQKILQSWTMSKPKISHSDFKLFCFTRNAFVESINPGAFGATFDLFRHIGYKANEVFKNEEHETETCYGAIGIKRQNFKTTEDTITIIETGDGRDKIVANPDENTYFIIGSGYKQIVGSARKNIFDLVGSEIRGFVNGSLGINTVIFRNYKSSGQLIFKTKTNVLTVAGRSTRVIFENIHNVIGRKDKTDIFIVSCHQKFIDGQNGDADQPDLIIVPFALCHYNLTIRFEQKTTVINDAFYGQFVYEIMVEKLDSEIKIHLTKFSRAHHIFLFKNLMLNSVGKLYVENDTCFLGDAQKSFDYVTITNFTLNTFLAFSDGFVVKLYHHNIIAFKIIENKIDPQHCITVHHQLSHRLSLIIVLQTRVSEFVMVFAAGQSRLGTINYPTDNHSLIGKILNNDPAQVTYLIGSNNTGNIFDIHIDFESKTSKDVFIYAPGPHTLLYDNVIDLSSIPVMLQIPIYINTQTNDQNTSIVMSTLENGDYKIITRITLLNCSTNLCLKTFLVHFDQRYIFINITKQGNTELKPYSKLKKTRQLTIENKTRHVIIDVKSIKNRWDFVKIDKNACNYILVRHGDSLVFVCNEAALKRRMTIIFHGYFRFMTGSILLKFKNRDVLIDKTATWKDTKNLTFSIQAERRRMESLTKLLMLKDN